jgi:hypothetical protein
MASLIIDARTLAAILEKHPEIQIELAKTAAAQIAEQLKRKVIGEQSTIVDGLIAEINSTLNYKYHLPDVARKVIREAAADYFKDLAERKAEEIARSAYEEAAARYGKKLEAKLDGMITTAIEKKVAAVFATAARLK